MATELERLRAYYASLSDEGLADAIEAGREAYRTPEIWEILTHEAALREAKSGAPMIPAEPLGSMAEDRASQDSVVAKETSSRTTPHHLVWEIGAVLAIAGGWVIPFGIGAGEQTEPALALLSEALVYAVATALCLFILWTRTGTLESTGLRPDTWSKEVLPAIPLTAAGVAAVWFGFTLTEALGVRQWEASDAPPSGAACRGSSLPTGRTIC